MVQSSGPASARYYSDLRQIFEVSFQIIGFCGKLYPVIGFTRRIPENNAIIFHWVYSLASLDLFLESNGYILNKKKPWWVSRTSYNFEHYSEYKRFLENTNNYDSLKLISQNANVPVFVYMENHRARTHQLILNPPLNAYSFVKRIDPYTAHQELYMYVTNFMAKPERPMVQLSDKDKIHKRGFDKWSFRRMPTKKGNK